MKFIADFHLHSKYSMATSAQSNLENLSAWAQVKGIRLLSTGDFTHPRWFEEISERLLEAEEGLYRLKEDKEIKLSENLSATAASTRFLLGAEISNIYKKSGRVRKNHNLIFAPDLQIAAAIRSRLEKTGNIRSDGRPILGLDTREMLAMLLEISPDIHLIPAHIWTPWFSLLGSKSGFDSVEECFGDLTSEIFALETGLSSDPSMNWTLSSLDRYSLVSNSDAHSPEKMGREVNIFNCELSYQSIFRALKEKEGFVGTVEFYSEEGKYHFDGHRKCGVVLEPSETTKQGVLCPACGKPLTIGVMNRITALADRKEPLKPPKSATFVSRMPLKEILGETLGLGPKSRKVSLEYARLIKKYGSEFTILCDLREKEFEDDSNPLLSEAMRRVRKGFVIKNPGFDGKYGSIRIFSEEERKSPSFFPCH